MKKANTISIFLVAAAIAFGQQPAENAGAAADDKQDQAASTDSSTAPADEGTVSHDSRLGQVITGNIEVGYRFVDNIGGNFNSYRSVVNLGEGPKLIHLDLSFAPPDQRLFHEIRLQADSWGGDPYNTIRVDAEKTDIYRLHASYSNIMYFNFLPSFANPQAGQGVLVDQRSYDALNRNSNASLDLFPGKRIIPFFAYDRSSGSGTGITPIVFDNDEFPIGNEIGWQSNDYRAGVRFEFNKWHISVEQGGTTFKDDQNTYFQGLSYGNRATSFFDQFLSLDGANQAYRVRGSSLYSMANGSATPFGWLTLTGQFLFSQPKTNVDYHEVAGGNLSSNNPFLFFNALTGVAAGTANMPHPSGNITMEIRPHSRVRILESVFTDRLHDASYGMSSNLLNPMNVTTTAAMNDLLEFTYNRQQFDVMFDATKFLTLRGGHRYEWGESTVRTPPYDSSAALETAQLKRQVALAGFVLRPKSGLTVTTDYERSAGDQFYFRTSLNDYHRLRAQVRYQVVPSLFLSVNAGFNQNENPSPGIGLDQQFNSYSASVNWLPQNAKRLSLVGEYTHSYFRSDLSYIAGPYFTTEYSRYRDNAHSATALVALNLPSIGAGSPRVDVGGSLFLSSGSRPMEYYQPIGRISVPIEHWMSAFGEWRWYGMSQTFYSYESFRSHQFTVGFRWTL